MGGAAVDRRPINAKDGIPRYERIQAGGHRWGVVLVQWEISRSPRAVAHHQHGHLLRSSTPRMNLLAPLSRRPVQVALPLTGIGKEGFIRFDNALQVFSLAVGG